MRKLCACDRETFDLLFPLTKASLAALGFHAQQAAEKALKAVGILLGMEMPRTHDLAALAQVIIDKGETLPLTIEQLRGLNPFAVEYRYDDELIPQTSREALAAMLAAIMSWAEMRLSA